MGAGARDAPNSPQSPQANAYVIPSVAEESRCLEKSQCRTSRFLGYARNDIVGDWDGVRGDRKERGIDNPHSIPYPYARRLNRKEE